MKSFRLADIDTLLRIYYHIPELTNDDIAQIFNGQISRTTILKIKKAILKKEAEMGVCVNGRGTVNTQVAYDVLGINVEDLEWRRKKLKELDLQ